jgi:2-iminobutanoate/2-iminopropanoate deaminase
MSLKSVLPLTQVPLILPWEMLDMSETIATSDAPAAIGPYSQGVRAGDLVFTSGQLGLDPATKTLKPDVVSQTEQAIANLSAVLKAAGCSLADVVKTTIFVTDLAHFSVINKAYGAHFQGSPPARSTVQVAALPMGGLVEIEMVAYAPRKAG